MKTTSLPRSGIVIGLATVLFLIVCLGTVPALADTRNPQPDQTKDEIQRLLERLSRAAEARHTETIVDFLAREDRERLDKEKFQNLGLWSLENPSLTERTVISRNMFTPANVNVHTIGDNLAKVSFYSGNKGASTKLFLVKEQGILGPAWKIDAPNSVSYRELDALLQSRSGNPLEEKHIVPGEHSLTSDVFRSLSLDSE